MDTSLIVSIVIAVVAIVPGVWALVNQANNDKTQIVHPGAKDGKRRVVWKDLAEVDNVGSPDRAALWTYWRELALHYAGLGFRGFRCDAAYQVPADPWRDLIGAVKAEHPDALFFAETLGSTPKETLATARAGFDFIFNSSKWWDFREPWCLEQYAITAPVVPSVSFPESHDTPRLAAEFDGDRAAVVQRYAFAAAFSAGVMMPIGFEYGFRQPLHVVETTPQDWEAPGWDLAGAAGAVAFSLPGGARRGPDVFAAQDAKPAILGGTPVHSGGWLPWPQWKEAWEPKMLEVYRSRKWFRLSGSWVTDFETAWARLLGARKCLATASGTTALIVSLHVMDVDAGDEVIVSPYTFIASYNAILTSKALPVFADTDPATLTLNPATIESRITDRTRAIMPVHIFGMPCDMDPINAILPRNANSPSSKTPARRGWRNTRAASAARSAIWAASASRTPSISRPAKAAPITGNSDDLVDRCQAFHNCGRATGSFQGHGCFRRA